MRGVVYPVCLPDPRRGVKPYIGWDSLLSGWGRTSWPAGKVSDTLKKIKLPIRRRYEPSLTRVKYPSQLFDIHE